jgi:hypothetical protein
MGELMIVLTPIQRAAICLDLAARHEHNEPYFKELVAEARTWSQIARNAERQIAEAAHASLGEKSR